MKRILSYLFVGLAVGIIILSFAGIRTYKQTPAGLTAAEIASFNINQLLTEEEVISVGKEKFKVSLDFGDAEWVVMFIRNASFDTKIKIPKPKKRLLGGEKYVQPIGDLLPKGLKIDLWAKLSNQEILYRRIITYNPLLQLDALCTPGDDFIRDLSNDRITEFLYVSCGDGKDTVIGNTTRCIINAGPGDDHIAGSNKRDSIHLDVGNDTGLGYGGNDEITGAWGDDLIIGGEGDDKDSFAPGLYGHEGDDIILGGSGDDEILGFLGEDILIAGPGYDVGNGGPDYDTIIQELDDNISQD